MDPTKLEQTLKQLDAAGASKEEIAQVYNAYKNQASSAPALQAPGTAPGFLQGILKTPAQLIENLHQAGREGKRMVQEIAGDTAGAAKTQSIYDDVQKNGENNPAFDQPIKSIGNSGDFGRDVAGSLGAGAEMASYEMGPVRMGAGFWNTIKEVAPMALTFGAGKGAETMGEGGSATDTALSTVGNTLGAAAGYGLLKGGANFFANWGARALQSDAVKAAGGWMKDFAEKTFGALPEAFQGTGQALPDMANASVRRTVNALQTEFDKNFSTSKNAIIDAIMPDVNTPDLTMSKFQRGLSESMGNKFRESNALYDSVKADQTKVDSFKVAGDALSKAATEAPVPGVNATPEERKAFIDAANSGSDAFHNFVNNAKAATKTPLTLKQIMGLWQDSMGALPGAKPDEKVVIRDFASGLYADARSVLEKKNPELLDQWDTAYQSWKKAGDLYTSGPLNTLKSVGDVDTFVDKAIGNTLTRPEKDTFTQSLGDSAPAVQDLFINSVLRKAKELAPADAHDLIDKFLTNFGDGFLSPKQTKMLDDISTFSQGNFDQFLLGMRKAQGLDTDTAGKLQGDQTNLDLLSTINDGRLDQISDRLTKMADSPDLEKTLAAFSPEEKNMIGLSITKNIFDQKLPVGALNADGKTWNINPDFANTIQELYSKISENKAMQKILNPAQLTALKGAASFAEKTTDLSEVPAAGYHRIMNGLVSIFYFARGWMPGGIRNAIEAAAGSGEKTVNYYAAVKDLLDQGLVQPNKQILMGDLIQKLLPGAGQTAINAAAGATGE